LYLNKGEGWRMSECRRKYNHQRQWSAAPGKGEASAANLSNTDRKIYGGFFG
jgi:hypothetical protein